MRIVVTGASGQLGGYVIDELKQGPHTVIAWRGLTALGPHELPGAQSVELTDHVAVEHSLDLADPDVILHLAAISSADAAHRDPRQAEAVNVAATRCLCAWASRRNRRLVFTSTDLVFDGSQSWSSEDVAPRPTGIYGQTKCAAESFVLEVPGGLVARLSLLYGPSHSDRMGFFDRAMAGLRAGHARAFFADEYRTPLDYPTAARVLTHLALLDTRGLLHVGGPERLSRFDLMRRAADALGIDPQLVIPNQREDVVSVEPRPADVSLDSSRLRGLYPDLPFLGVEAALAPFRPAAHSAPE